MVVVGELHRNPALEAAIAAEPLSAPAYLVYADWLEQRGDPRAELIRVEHAMLAATSLDEQLRLRDREDALFARHARHLLGPLYNTAAEPTFYLGFVRHLEIAPLGWQAMFAEIVTSDHPSLRFLASVRVPYPVPDLQAQLDAAGRSGLIVISDPGAAGRLPAGDDVLLAQVRVTPTGGRISVAAFIAGFAEELGRFAHRARTVVESPIETRTWWWDGGDELLTDGQVFTGIGWMTPWPGEARIHVQLRLGGGEGSPTIWLEGDGAIRADQLRGALRLRLRPPIAAFAAAAPAR